MSFFKRMFSQKDNENKTPSLVVGDIFYTYSNSKYCLHKLLAIDPEFEVHHVLSYSPLSALPSIEDIDRVAIFVYHSPFDKKAFENPIVLTNKSITTNDLIGYHEYLRQTQDPHYYASIASDYYNAGNLLTNDKKYYEAIDSYSKAIDLFPQFFEAIDNRAFCKMDLGLWLEAIQDFKLSLLQNPNSVLAEFSIGECYFKIGEYKKAKQQFEISHKIDPEHPAPREFLEKVNAILNK